MNTKVEVPPVFKQGDTVELFKHPNRPYGIAAPIGSTAVVTKDYYKHHRYIELQWIDKGESNQSDGGYSACYFKKVEPMKFEVGKKYVHMWDRKTVLECVYSGNPVVVLKGPDRDYTLTVWDENYKEYKEPRSITRWGIVYEDAFGLQMSHCFAGTKEEAEKCVPNYTRFKALDIYKVEWVEKT